MGLFDKKFCDVCGEKIGMLGNRKLEDGNLCKDCARKLSPFFSERRSSTVAEIKQQLAYREENKRNLASFTPTMTFGESMKVMIDQRTSRFIVTRSNDWKNANPDLIALSQVVSVDVKIEENKSEIYTKDAQGNRVSYNPKRYEYDYEFNVTIQVNSPWFNEIRFELSDGNRPESPYTDLYRNYQQQATALQSALKPGMAPNITTGNFDQMPVNGGYAAPMGAGFAAAQMGTFQQPVQQPFANNNYYNQNAGFQQPMQQPGYVQPQQTGYVQQPAYTQPQQTAYAQPQQTAQSNWFCQNCGASNAGAFCQNCGTPRPQPVTRMIRCDKCGWVAQDPSNAPRFCPNCGDPIDFRDMQ